MQSQTASFPCIDTFHAITRLTDKLLTSGLFHRVQYTALIPMKKRIVQIRKETAVVQLNERVHGLIKAMASDLAAAASNQFCGCYLIMVKLMFLEHPFEYRAEQHMNHPEQICVDRDIKDWEMTGTNAECLVRMKIIVVLQLFCSRHTAFSNTHVLVYSILSFSFHLYLCSINVHQLFCILNSNAIKLICICTSERAQSQVQQHQCTLADILVIAHTSRHTSDTAHMLGHSSRCTSKSTHMQVHRSTSNCAHRWTHKCQCTEANVLVIAQTCKYTSNSESAHMLECTRRQKHL